jgi:hypothetical protein
MIGEKPYRASCYRGLVYNDSTIVLNSYWRKGDTASIDRTLKFYKTTIKPDSVCSYISEYR